jgi:uncharacterized protein (DUF433 family)
MATKSTALPSSEEAVLPVMAEYIAVKPGFCGGKPHLLGHRIKVQHVAVWHERMGMTPEEIVANHPGLSLSAVYAALAYYHAHRTEIDADIVADEQFVDEMKAKAGRSLREKQAQLHAPDASLPSG